MVLFPSRVALPERSSRARRKVVRARLSFGPRLVEVMEERRLLSGPPTFGRGDVLVGEVGVVDWRLADGTQVATINTHSGIGNNAGMAFDQNGNLYSTDFTHDSITKIDPSGNVLGTFGKGIPFGSHPESIVFDTVGNAYVGLADGGGKIIKLDAQGNLLETYQAATDDRGTDWVELAPDQHTLYYTSEGDSVKRFDTSTNQQLPNFASGLPGSHAYALRLLADGSVLVADSASVLHLDPSGKIINQYKSADPNDVNLFALNLDPDGTSFWTGDLTTGDIIRFDLASGAELSHFIASPMGATGLIVKGEIIQAAIPKADLAVTPVNPPSKGTLGSDTILTFQVTNNGPATATNVMLGDPMPAGLNFLASIPQRMTTPGAVAIPLGTLAAGASTTVTLVVSPTVAGSIADAVGVWATEVDPNLSNNIAAVIMTVPSPPPPPPPPVLDGPVVIGVQWAGGGLQPPVLVLNFNEPLDPLTSQLVGNYTIAILRNGQRPVRGQGPTVPLSRVTYDPHTNTVVLWPARRPSPMRHYGLIINGTTATGVKDSAGRLLDGLANGHPGSDYIAALPGFGRR